MNDTREEQLLNAGKAADAEKKTDMQLQMRRSTR